MPQTCNLFHPPRPPPENHMRNADMFLQVKKITLNDDHNDSDVRVDNCGNVDDNDDVTIMMTTIVMLVMLMMMM